jgi:outer membrane lipoprotein SlyB
MTIRTSAVHFLAAAMIFSFPLISGCGQNLGGYDYNEADARSAGTYYQATAIAVEKVRINSENRQGNQTLGAAVGGVIGGVIGSTMGHHTGRTLATLGGAALGAAAGAGVGEVASHQTGLQITVQYDDGAEEVIVQGTDPAIYAGQRVTVIVSSNNERRVIPAN